jgi:hypothetical protein
MHTFVANNSFEDEWAKTADANRVPRRKPDGAIGALVHAAGPIVLRDLSVDRVHSTLPLHLFVRGVIIPIVTPEGLDRDVDEDAIIEEP